MIRAAAFAGYKTRVNETAQTLLMPFVVIANDMSSMVLPSALSILSRRYAAECGFLSMRIRQVRNLLIREPPHGLKFLVANTERLLSDAKPDADTSFVTTTGTPDVASALSLAMICESSTVWCCPPLPPPPEPPAVPVPVLKAFSEVRYSEMIESMITNFTCGIRGTSESRESICAWVRTSAC